MRIGRGGWDLLYSGAGEDEAMRTTVLVRKRAQEGGAIAVTAVWLVVFVFIFGVVSWFVPYKIVTYSICPVTASIRTQTTWFGLFKRDTRTTNALDKWLERKESGFQPQWQRLSTDTYYALGGKSFACSPAPPAYELQPVVTLPGFQKLSDDKIAALVAVLRRGTPSEQERMIETVGDEVFAGN
jgi:hypothetical protein